MTLLATWEHYLQESIYIVQLIENKYTMGISSLKLKNRLILKIVLEGFDIYNHFVNIKISFTFGTLNLFYFLKED